jgi:arsenate reductase
MKIYHNPRCSKSRSALQLLTDKGVDVEVVKYLEDTPSKAELIDVLKKLSKNAEEIVRKGEPDYKDNFKGRKLSDDEWINAFIQFPKLIERPIFINGDKAIIGRPPEVVLTLL